MPFSASVKRSVTAVTPVTPNNLTTPTNAPQGSAVSTNFTEGVAANQAKQIFTKDYTIADGAQVDIDLSTFGGETDANKGAYLNTRIKGLQVDEVSANANAALLVGGEGSADQFNSIFNAVDSSDGDLAGAQRLRIEHLGGVTFANPTASGYACGAGNKLLRIKSVGGVTAIARVTIVCAPAA